MHFFVAEKRKKFALLAKVFYSRVTIQYLKQLNKIREKFSILFSVEAKLVNYFGESGMIYLLFIYYKCPIMN